MAVRASPDIHTTITDQYEHPHNTTPTGRYLALLSLTALGIVYDDIGTSPLYAMRECFHGPHAIAATPDNIFGVLSPIFWSLIIIISIKYCIFVLRADNHCERGMLALTAEVIYTLVDNAAKYSPKGANINVAAESTDSQTVQLIVEDEGSGIPAELRERVFDKFFRAMRNGDSGTRRPSGSGMGLAIAKGIVEAHGGRIYIEDGVAGRGSRFVVSLPLGDKDETALDSNKESDISGNLQQAAHSNR